MDGRNTADEQPAVSISLGWLPALGVAAAALYPALQGAYWAMPLSGAAAWAGIGVWRIVHIQGLILNHMHWRDVEVPASDETLA